MRYTLLIQAPNATIVLGKTFTEEETKTLCNLLCRAYLGVPEEGAPSVLIPLSDSDGYLVIRRSF